MIFFFLKYDGACPKQSEGLRLIIEFYGNLSILIFTLRTDERRVVIKIAAGDITAGCYDPYLSLQVISEILHVARGVHFQFTSKSVKYNSQPL